MSTAAETEATTYYVLFEDGSVSLMTSTTGEMPALGKPGRSVSREEYETRQAEIRAAREKYVADLQAEDDRRTREDYEALISSGVPEATARRLSGYTGEAADN
ncbi:hypothetical protein ACWEFD_18175 [Streptomyces ardesiacus]